MLVVMAFNQNLRGPNVLWVKGLNQCCHTTWWYNLIGIQNYMTDKSCLSHAWYIGADMQLYAISPLLLFPLNRYRWKFIKVLVGLFLASAFYLFYAYHIADHPWNVIFGTHARFGPWIAGIILGFYLYQAKEARVDKVKRSKYLVLSSIVWILAYYIFYSQPTYAYYAVYNRHLFAIFITWLIYSCQNGYLPILNKCLSLPCFQFTSKLSYCVYLLHLPLWDTLIALNRFPLFYEPVTRFFQFISLAMISLGLALIWTLLFELPWSNLERNYQKRYKALAVTVQT